MPRPYALRPRPQGFTLVELLVAMAIIAVLATITFTATSAAQQKANMKLAAEKLRSVGTAFVTYASDNNGAIPWEDSVVGSNDWAGAALPQNADVWYNALPLLMGAQSVGELGANPGVFYDESYPLYLRGAGYPGENKQAKAPFFAFAMNSRLQRKAKDSDGIAEPGAVKPTGRIGSIVDPGRTVAFLERGLPRDSKSDKRLGGYDGFAKANARNFVCRYNGKGLLLFVDGHIDAYAPSDVLDAGGRVIQPQERIVWTPDPESNPD